MKTIYSIGHSIKSWEDFMQELESVKFNYLVDVRSYPYSRFVPQYNQNRIKEKLWEKYIFMWDTLGWMDEEISNDKFMFWIDKLSNLAEKSVVLFMCSEWNFTKCHRYKKLTPELEIRKFKVIHL